MRVVHLEPRQGRVRKSYYIFKVGHKVIFFFTRSPIISTRKTDSNTVLTIGKCVSLNPEWSSRNSDLEKEKYLRRSSNVLKAGEASLLPCLPRCLHPIFDVTHARLFARFSFASHPPGAAHFVRLKPHCTHPVFLIPTSSAICLDFPPAEKRWRLISGEHHSSMLYHRLSSSSWGSSLWPRHQPERLGTLAL